MSRRGRRYHQRFSESDSDFETPALREINNRAAARGYDSDDSDEKSESGLGDSPEEELLEENPEEEDGDANDNSDDDAPEDLSFTSSREVEKKRMQNILQEIQKGREEMKEKRRKKDELFKTQKQEKLAALSKRKLPTEILEAISSKKQKKSSKNTKPDKGKEVGKDDAEALAPANSNKEEQSNSEESDFDDGDGGPGPLGDFVSLTDPEKTNEDEAVVVVPLNKTKNRAAPVSQNVADFKQNMLYSKHIKRVSSQKMRAVQAKRKALKAK